MRLAIGTTLVLACTFSAFAACSRPDQPIVLGLAGPFSQPRAESMQRAAELAVQEINARGGVHGRQLELRIRDDSASEGPALRIAQDFLADSRIVAVVGHLNSAPSRAAAQLYRASAEPLAMVSPSASGPDLSGMSEFFFRVCPSDLSFGQQLAHYAHDVLAARRAGVIFVNDDYGRGVRRTFVTEFVRLGGTVAEEDPYLPRVGSAEPYLSRMRAAGGVDVLILATDRSSAEIALRDRAQLGLPWLTLGADGLTGVELLGGLAEGVRIATAYLPDRPGERNAQFVAAYARAYPGKYPDHRGAGAYDIVYLLARAIERVGTGRSAIRDYLARVGTSEPAFDGVTGRIAFDQKGDVPSKPVVIGVVRSGRIVTERAP
jgi:branched-chain amino acid transport system substrate-binding protein